MKVEINWDGKFTVSYKIIGKKKEGEGYYSAISEEEDVIESAFRCDPTLASLICLLPHMMNSLSPSGATTRQTATRMVQNIIGVTDLRLGEEAVEALVALVDQIGPPS